MTVDQRTQLRPAASLRGTVKVPSDKSIAHRALICGALATGESRIRLREPGEDVRSTLGALRALDAEVHTTDGHAPLVITGRRPLRSVEHSLPVASAQVLGAISIAALTAEGTTRVLVPGQTRDHTERMLAAMGASISRSIAH